MRVRDRRPSRMTVEESGTDPFALRALLLLLLTGSWAESDVTCALRSPSSTVS